MPTIKWRGSQNDECTKVKIICDLVILEVSRLFCILTAISGFSKIKPYYEPKVHKLTNPIIHNVYQTIGQCTYMLLEKLSVYVYLLKKYSPRRV